MDNTLTFLMTISQIFLIGSHQPKLLKFQVTKSDEILPVLMWCLRLSRLILISGIWLHYEKEKEPQCWNNWFKQWHEVLLKSSAKVLGWGKVYPTQLILCTFETDIGDIAPTLESRLAPTQALDLRFWTITKPFRCSTFICSIKMMNPPSWKTYLESWIR